MLSADDHHIVGSACHHCELSSKCLLHLAVKKTKHLTIKRQLMEAGTVLSKSSQSSDYLYIVQSGSFKHATVTFDGNEQVADFYLPGDIIGLDSLGTEQLYDLTALEPSHACAIEFKELETLAKNQSWLSQKLMRLLSQKLLSRTAALLIQHQHAEQKLAAFLLNISTRLQKIGHASRSYNLTMSRQEIGNYLHLSTETVSRIFSKFQGERLIDVQKKHVFLRDIKRLNAKVAH
ncbi:MAG: helix-turn-helix domain-containing protein [Gammaproteobacteria bacterium]|nr:helix-turn-helix domain-containing protein [Gammaproteobacteria bacterium]